MVIALGTRAAGLRLRQPQGAIRAAASEEGLR